MPGYSENLKSLRTIEFSKCRSNGNVLKIGPNFMQKCSRNGWQLFPEAQ